MCGIAGIIDFSGRPVEAEELRVMADRMRHRGPNDEGYFRSANVGLAMRRLSIIDLSGGQQPIANEDGTIWVVLNGEIYNFIELRRELEKKGHRFKTQSDTEVIVHLYEEKGTGAVNDLNGMFAFALYDSIKRALWVVRDRLGIKPLFYCEEGGQFQFSSDLDSLCRGVSRRISTQSLALYLAYSYVPTPSTIYEGMMKLPPAHWLWIENGRVLKRSYWSINGIQDWRGSVADAAEAVHGLLADAVRLQMRSDVPVGVFLSGGLDSSAVAAFAATHAEQPLQTLTIDFEGKSSSDALFARMVSERYQTVHHELHLGSNKALDALDEMIGRIDEPIYDSALIPSYTLAKHGLAAGFKVLLTGAGGDEIFAGYRRHHPPSFGSPTWVAEALHPTARSLVSSVWQLFQPNRGLRARAPSFAFASTLGGLNFQTCKRLIHDRHLLDRLEEDIQRRFRELDVPRSEGGYIYSRMMLDLGHYLVDDVLALTDKATMAASVEARVPLLDHRLVELAFSLPEQINVLRGRPKGLFREVMKPLLPASLLRRGKEGFNGPVEKWLLLKDKKRIEDELLSPTPTILDEIIERKSLKRLLENDSQRSESAHLLFGLYVFSRWWHRRFAGPNSQTSYNVDRKPDHVIG